MSENEKSREDLMAEIKALRARVAESDRLKLALEAAEDAYTERGRRMEAFIRAFPVLIFVIDREGRYLRVFTEQSSQLIADPNNLLGHTLHDFFPADQADLILSAIGRSLDTGEAQVIEYRIAVPAGEIIFEGRIAPVYPHDPASGSVIFAAQDITERKRTENTLAENERKFRLLYNDAPLPYQSLNSDGEIVEVNNAWCSLLGYEREEVVGRHISEFLSDDSRAVFDSSFPFFKEKGEVAAIDYEMLTKSGIGLLVSITGKITSDTETGDLRTHCILRDITYERQMENDLRRSEEQFRQLAENIKEVYWLRDIENDVFIYVSPTYEEVWGRSILDLIQKPDSFLDAVYHEDRDLLVKSFRQAGEGDIFEAEIRLVMRDKSLRWIHLRSFPVRNRKGEIYRSAGVGTDITEIKAKEEALKTAADIVASIPSGLFIYQYSPPDHLVMIDANPEALKRTHHDPEECLGKEFDEIWPNANDGGLTEKLLEVARTGVPCEIEQFDYEDEVVSGTYWIRAFSIPGDRLCLAFEDITEQIAITAAEKKQRALADALVKTSEAINKTLDYDELLGRILDLLIEVVPHDGANIMMMDPAEDVIKIVKTCACYDQNDIVRPDSTKYRLEEAPHLARILDTGQPLVLPDTFSYPGWIANEEGRKIRSYAGAAIIVEGLSIGILSVDSMTPNFFSEEDAATLRAFANQASIAIRNARLYRRLETYSETLAAAVEARTEELQSLNEELKVLSALKDEFVANISHELNSPVTSLKIQLHLLNMNPEGMEKYLPIMRRETERLERTIQDLLQLSRLDQGQQKWEIGPMEINELITQIVDDRSSLAEQMGLELVARVTPALPIIRADGGLIGQVLHILLSNALTYTPAGGSIVISSEKKVSGKQTWVGFSVSDNGPGIPPDEQAHLFDRFIRGKDAVANGKPGTGIGLALAKEIVEGHRGRLELQSTGIPGEGSTFTVWLPISRT